MHELLVILIALAAGTSVFWLVCLVGCERILARGHLAGRVPTAGLGETFSRVLELSGSTRRPKLFVVADPFPCSWAARAPFSHGVVAVSDGLLRRCDEARLREVLASAIQRLDTPGIQLQSVCGGALTLLFRIPPRDWLRGTLVGGSTRRLGFMGALRLLLALPWIRLFISLIRKARRQPWSRSTGLSERLGLERLYLPSSIDRPSSYAGCMHLYVVDPWTRPVVFPLFE